MIPRDRITGVVLAGGRGARMGGVDKGLVTFRGEPLVSHALARLRPQAGALAVNANRHLDAYARFGVDVFADAVDGDAPRFDGPLAGLCAAMRAVATEWVVTVPVDAPFFPDDLVARLASTGADAAYATTDERMHPVFALARVALRPRLEAALRDGRRAMREGLEAMAAVPVVFPDESAFRNLNTARELDDASR